MRYTRKFSECEGSLQQVKAAKSPTDARLLVKFYYFLDTELGRLLVSPSHGTSFISFHSKAEDCMPLIKKPHMPSWPTT